MKKTIIILTALIFSVISLVAADYLFIHLKNNTVVALDMTSLDSIAFTSGQSELAVYRNTQSANVYPIAAIDSITFASMTDETIRIIYYGTNVSIINPFTCRGVDVAVSGADVTINSNLSDKEITCSVSGTTTDGSLKIYSNFRHTLALNGADITNTRGPAINIQSRKKCTFLLTDGTTNSLADGITYASGPEDQKSTLFSEGQLIIKGGGTLNILSRSKHAICSDDYIEIEGGTIHVTSAAKDGFHANDHFNLEAGTVTVAATGDAVDCEEGNIKVSGGSITSTIATNDTKGLKSDSTIFISGGNIDFTVSGKQAKGLKSGGNITITGGITNITCSGGVVLQASGSGSDPSYCTAIKSDKNILISGGDVNINHSGEAGKGISADGNLEISGGRITSNTSGNGNTYTNSSGLMDGYNATCITTNSDLRLIAGDITCSASGTGGKGISAGGNIIVGSTEGNPVVSLTTTGKEISVTSGRTITTYASPKTMKADGDITFNNGTTTIWSSDDGIKSESNVYLYGGNINVNKSYEGIEAPYIYLSGAYADVLASNDAINTTKGTRSGGVETPDGSCLYINSGTLIATCTNGDGIDSNGSIIMTGGTAIVNGPSTGVEEAVDYNDNFNMNGGVFIGAGSNSSMTKSMSVTSTQPNMYVSSGSMISSATLIDIRINSTDVITFKPKYGAYKFLLSTPKMTKEASYTIYTGGSYSSATNTAGLYTGGTYTPGTSKKTGTLSSSGTVTSVSF